MGEAAEFLGARKGALSAIHATIKILKLSMEAAQEIIPSLGADLISIQKQERSGGRGMEGRGEMSLMVKWQSSRIALNFIPVLQEKKTQPRQNKHNRAYLGGKKKQQTKVEIGKTKKEL